MREVAVRVTAGDIAHGFRNSCSDCPIALALKRALPEFDNKLSVDTDSFYGDWDGEMHPLPQKAQDFIFDLDAGRHVKPFTFVVRL